MKLSITSNVITLAAQRLPMLLVALLVFLLDRASKSWVIDKTIAAEQLASLQLFDLQLGEFGLATSLSINRGIAFGLFDWLGDYSQVPIIVLSLAIALLFAKFAIDARPRIARLAASLIFGGATGNIYDRLRYDGVLDFIDAYAYGYHWYTFNLADAAISSGVALWLGAELFNLAKK